MKANNCLEQIKSARLTNQLSHAYLLHGQDLSMIKELSFNIAASLICPNNACMTCVYCQKVFKNQYVDLIYFDLSDTSLKKDQVLELKSHFSQMPVEGSIKVYLISNVFNASTSALNSLLKFLEEPTGNVVAILMTDNIDQGLNTIISRCRVIQIDALSPSEVREKLNDIDSEFLEIISQVVTNISLAKWYLSQPQISDFIKNTQDYITNKIDGQQTVHQELYFYQIKDKKWLELFCDLLIYASKSQNDLYNNKISKLFDLDGIIQVIELRNELSTNINQALVIDQLFAI